MLLPSRAALPAGFCPVLSVSCQTGETGSNSEAGRRWGCRGNRKGGGGGGGRVAFREKACCLIVVCVKQKDGESTTRGPWALLSHRGNRSGVSFFHADAVICMSQPPAVISCCTVQMSLMLKFCRKKKLHLI